MKLNVGSGQHPLEGYCNLDSVDYKADVVAKVPPLPFQDESIEEIYAGHFLEHLSFWDGRRFLRECHRCLQPEGRLAVVVPDTANIMARYLEQKNALVCLYNDISFNLNDLDDVCRTFLYAESGTGHKSPVVMGHKWSFDSRTLYHALKRAGFTDLGVIDRFDDPRLTAGAWFQCGWEGVKA